jgi:hypothetical protein
LILSSARFWVVRRPACIAPIMVIMLAPHIPLPRRDCPHKSDASRHRSTCRQRGPARFTEMGGRRANARSVAMRGAHDNDHRRTSLPKIQGVIGCSLRLCRARGCGRASKPWRRR